MISLALALGLQEWSKVADFLYQLQEVDAAAVGDSKFDLVITDPSRDGTDAGRWTAGEIERMRRTPKLILAYLSIGEAEEYRGYWMKGAAPKWLGPVNPDWPGNYKVRYWDPDWQKIVFDELDRIVAAGFDGAYLDIIDAYEFWSDRKTAEREMVDFVKAIAARARRAKKSFAIFPQNGDGLARHADYVETVTGIGREDLFYDDDKRQTAGETKQALANLDIFRKAGKLVLITDYPTKKEHVDETYARATEKGYVPYATVRELNRLTINKGHEPK